MADYDWNNVTHIGSRVRGGGGGAPRQNVVRGNSALNAARRSGAIADTEKKLGSANSKPSVDGQRLASIDRTDAPKPPPKVGKEVGEIIMKRRNEMTPVLTQKELSKRCNTTPQIIQNYEQGTAVPDQNLLLALERALGVNLRGSHIGKPRFPPKKK